MSMKAVYDSQYIQLVSLIRKARINKGLTQEQLAIALDVDQSFVSKIENRERKLDVMEFLQIVTVLELKLNELLPESYFSNGTQK